jgi:hypothetical protein
MLSITVKKPYKVCFHVLIANELCSWYKFWLFNHKIFLSTSCNAYALNLPLRPVPVFADVLSLLQFHAHLWAALCTCHSLSNSCFQTLTTEWVALQFLVRQVLYPDLGPVSCYPASSFPWYSSVSSSSTPSSFICPCLPLIITPRGRIHVYLNYGKHYIYTRNQMLLAGQNEG